MLQVLYTLWVCQCIDKVKDIGEDFFLLGTVLLKEIL